jgi:hypothetical protein
MMSITTKMQDKEKCGYARCGGDFAVVGGEAVSEGRLLNAAQERDGRRCARCAARGTRWQGGVEGDRHGLAWLTEIASVLMHVCG